MPERGVSVFQVLSLSASKLVNLSAVALRGFGERFEVRHRLLFLR